MASIIISGSKYPRSPPHVYGLGPGLRLTAGNAIIAIMKSVTVRNLDEDTKARLRVRAARHDRSMEEEMREILRAAVAGPEAPGGNLADAIRRRFERLGGVALELPVRT